MAAERFDVAREGTTLVLTPQADLRELDPDALEEEGQELLALAGSRAVRHVVVDLGRTNEFGAAALGLFTGLWRAVGARDGRLAFCNASAQQWDLLTRTGLVDLWHVYPSLEDAVEAVTA
jgi:anti-anti-sigma factor